MKNIGNAMRAQRLLSNKTLLQVEKDTGISNASISRWETGKVIPNVEDCIILAEYYGVTLRSLFLILF